MGNLTEKQIAEIALGLLKSYERLRYERGINPNVKCDILYYEICNFMRDNSYDGQQQEAAIKLFNMYVKGIYPQLISSPSQFTPLSTAVSQFTPLSTTVVIYPNVFYTIPQYRPQTTVLIISSQYGSYIHYDDYYYSYTDTFLTWWLIGNLLSGNYYSHSGRYDSRNQQEALLAIIVVIIVGVALVMSVIALAYLMRESANGIERIVFDEGRKQAFINLISTAAAATALALVGGYFLSGPLAAFFFSAGMANPLGLVVFIIVSMSLVGAALTCAVVKNIQQHSMEHNNQDALVPQDPYRYRIKADEDKLKQRNIDPDKLNFVIKIFQKALGDVPSLLEVPWKSRTAREQSQLNALRKAVQGETKVCEVNKSSYDLQNDEALPPPYTAFA